MSLSDFAFPSQYSTFASNRPISAREKRNTLKAYDDLNQLIYRIHDAKNLRRISLLNLDGQSKSRPDPDDVDVRADVALLDFVTRGCVDNNNATLIEGPSSENSLMKRSRPWTSPAPLGSPLLKRSNDFRLNSPLLPNTKSSKSLDATINSSNAISSQLHRIYERGLFPSKYALTLREPKPLKFQKRSVKNKRHKTATVMQCKTLVEHHLGDRNELYHRRNVRMENAKRRRETLFRYRMTKLEGSLEKKYQTRQNIKDRKDAMSRRAKILSIIIIGSTMQRWSVHSHYLLRRHKERKTWEMAAITIQAKWKREKFSRTILEAVRIRSNLEKFQWRFRLWALSTRRRVMANLLRSFLFDVSNRPLCHVLYTFRSSVMRAQTLMRGYVDCKRARLETLTTNWVKVEKEVMTLEQQRMKRRHDKANSLSDIAQRKVLSKGLLNIVVNVASALEDDRPKSVSQIKPLTSPKVYQNVCRFYLEDSRRSHVQQSLSNHCVPVITISHDDAKTLLSDGDVLVDYENIRADYSPFILYSHQHRFRKEIEGFRQKNDKRALKEIKERLIKECEIKDANRFATNDVSRSQIQILTDVNNEISIETINLSEQFAVPPHVIDEMRQLFNVMLIRGTSSLNSDRMEDVFGLVGLNRDDVETVIYSITSGESSTINFEMFLRGISHEMNAKYHFRHSKEKLLDAFKYFEEVGISNSNSGDYQDGRRIHRSILIDHLQKYGDGKLSDQGANSLLQNVGLSTDILDYKEFVDRAFLVRNCTTLQSFYKRRDD